MLLVKWIPSCLIMILMCGVSLVAAQAQNDCGCGSVAMDHGFSDYSGYSECDNGAWGGGNNDRGPSFLSKLRNRMSCTPSMKQGLWDGYCQERNACQNNDCGSSFGRHAGGHGGGIFSGHGGRQHRHHGCGCGSSGYGIPEENIIFDSVDGCGNQRFSSDCGCDGAAANVVSDGGFNAGSGFNAGGGCGAGRCGCAGVFGASNAGSSCFRNDGHFFSGFSRHGHRHHGQGHRQHGCGHRHGSGCGCSLFSQRGGRSGGCHRSQRNANGQSFDCNCLGCGHCQNGGDMQSYSIAPGAASMVPGCGCDG